MYSLRRFSHSHPISLPAFLALLLTAPAARAASTIFVPLPPCRIADTRVAGGPIASNTNRIFKVVGVATDFTSQGGVASGCGVPGFSGVVAQVQAIALNVAAANHASAGFLTAFAGDTSRPLASTLNFTAGTTIANGVIVPVRQAAPEGNDLKVFVNLTSDVFMDVTGYFTDITLVDGAGSGIDADTLDGLDSAAFGQLAASNTWTGNTTFDPAAGFALTTGTGDDIDLGGNIRKAGKLLLHDTGVDSLGTGREALKHNTGGANTAVGVVALYTNTTGFGDTASGKGALALNTTGYKNTATGTDALYDNTIGSANTAVGDEALRHNTIGATNTATGVYALFTNTAGNSNTAIGTSALYANTIGSSNTATGAFALAANTTGVKNTATGLYALRKNTTGQFGSAHGYRALYGNTTGVRNTATGAEALATNTTGYRNTACGAAALKYNSYGYKNTAVGAYALRNAGEPTGSLNIGLGYKAGFNLTTGDNNIDIGNEGIAAESATIRIGTVGTQTAAFLAGVFGSTIDGSGVGVFVDSNGQLGTTVSSRRYKEEIRDMGEASERLLKLRPVTFRYRKEVQKGERPTEYGLIAEEVAEAFPELVVYGSDGRPETVKYHVLVPLLLNELQKQKVQVENEKLRAQEREGRLEHQLAGERSARERLEEEMTAQKEDFTTQLAAERERSAAQSQALAAVLDRLAAVEGRMTPADAVLAKAGTGPPGPAGASAPAPRR